MCSSVTDSSTQKNASNVASINVLFVMDIQYSIGCNTSLVYGKAVFNLLIVNKIAINIWGYIHMLPCIHFSQ